MQTFVRYKFGNRKKNYICFQMMENIPENGFKYESFELDKVEITPCPEKRCHST